MAVYLLPDRPLAVGDPAEHVTQYGRRVLLWIASRLQLTGSLVDTSSRYMNTAILDCHF